MAGKETDLVLMAQIGAAHGVRGDVRVKSFGADPMALADYGPLFDETGARRFVIRSLRPQKSVLIVRFENVTGRTEAETLNGTRLYLMRDALPPAEDEDEFYHVDLIGLTVFTIDDERVGNVIAVPDFGAGDLLEVKSEKGPSFLVPFTKDIVPRVDLKAGRIVIDPPDGLLSHQKTPDDEDQDQAR